jgi:HAD superfamily hydrolase (TIGR01509 family)
VDTRDRRSFDAVIFDCDGVLVASERLVNDIEARLLGQLGLSWSADETRSRFKGRTVGDIATVLESLLERRLPADWLYDLGIETALGFVEHLRCVPGVREVLELMAARKVVLAVASQSSPARVRLSLQLAQLAGYFDDRVFTAARVPRAKPCPDVFLFAAARLGVDPRRCAVIEDSPSGVAAAVSAGMSVFGYAADEDAGALASAGALVFDDMRSLPALLDAASTDRAHDEKADAVSGLLRGAYDRFFAGDPRGLVDFLAEDAVYHLPGGHLGGGTLRGRAEILERTARAAASCEEPPAMRLLGVVGTADVLLSVERITASRRGRRLDQEVCVVWRIHDGRCVEMWGRFDDQPACDRFWDV